VLGLVWVGHLGEPRAALDPDEQPTTLSGAYLAMRRSTWDDLGGFDMEFFAYHEDVDLCWRTRQHGLTLRLVYAASVRHHYEFSRNARKMYLMERKRLLFVLTTYESSTFALLALLATTFDAAQLPLPAAGRPLESAAPGLVAARQQAPPPQGRARVTTRRRVDRLPPGVPHRRASMRRSE